MRQITLTTLNKEKNAFMKKIVKCGIFSLVFVIKLGGRMTEIFSARLRKKEDLTEYITM